LSRIISLLQIARARERGVMTPRERRMSPVPAKIIIVLIWPVIIQASVAADGQIAIKHRAEKEWKQVLLVQLKIFTYIVEKLYRLGMGKLIKSVNQSEEGAVFFANIKV
jgi:hypothetical protein